MISTGAFQTEMNASNKQPTLAKKFAAVWEKKNAKAARAGGVSLMALSLAACGSDDATTTATTTTDTATTTTTTTAAGGTFDLTPLVDIASSTQALNGSLSSTFRFTDGNETVNGMTATMASTDTLLDQSTTDADVLNVTVTGATTITTSNIETINLNYAVAAQDFTAANTGTTTYNVSGSVAGTLSTPASGSTVNLDSYGRILTVEGLTLTGTAAAGSAESLSISMSGATYGATAATQTAVTIDGTDGEQLEAVNIASNGSSANTFAIAFENTETVGTYTITGAQDLNMRALDSKVSGTTIDATANTGNVGINLATAGGVTVNAANWTGVDDIVVYDADATAGAITLNSIASGQNVVVNNSVTTLTVAPVGAVYTALAAAADLDLNGTSATAGVTVTTYAAQNITALNLESLGLASSVSTTAANTIANLDGDFTTITITGDTSLKITDLDIEAVETASTTTARAVTVNAADMTGNAYVDITASADAKVSYTITGTGGADTIVANASGSSLTGGAGADTLTGGNGVDAITGGAGADHIDMSYGADTLTGGTGNDTYDLNNTAAAASAQSSTILNTADGNAGSADDALTVTINGVSYNYTTASAGTTTAINYVTAWVAQHKNAILAEHGITVTGLDASSAASATITMTGKADGTAFTASAIDFAANAGTGTAITATTTDGAAALDVASTISDFQAGDIMDVVGISLTADGGYYEGAAGSFTQATEYQVIVLTGASYTSSTTAADAIDARYGGTDSDSQLFVYLDSTDGHAVMAYDSDINTDGAATLNELANFDSITNLTDLASIMSADTFTLA